MAHPGDTLRAWRIKAGLTQEELAGECDLNPRTIYNIESQKTDPRRRTLERVLIVLQRHKVNISPHELFPQLPPNR